MLEVQKYLKENSLDALTEEFGIKVFPFITDKGDTLYVLNYCQFGSPKLHPIIKECRSLVLDSNFELVSRSFDRFFNYGESGCTLDLNDEVEFVEKADGSLIGVFQYKGDIYWRTKSLINPDNVQLILPGEVDTELSWGSIFDESFSGGGRFIESDGVIDFFKENPDHTLILELCSKHNKVVIDYEVASLKLLSVRNRVTGEYVPQYALDYIANKLNVDQVERFTISTMEDAIELIDRYNQEGSLVEGFVVYQNDIPVSKLKNPTYVAAHHLKGEVMPTPRIATDMVIDNETDEFLTLFPEYKPLIEPYIKAKQVLLDVTDQLLNQVLADNEIVNAKEFVITLKNHESFLKLTSEQQGVAFSMLMSCFNKKMTPTESFNAMTMISSKRRAIMAFS